MSLRRGVTAAEEAKMRKAIAAGKSWTEIAVTLDDVEQDYVKEHIYEPLLAEHKAGKDIAAPPVPSEEKAVNPIVPPEEKKSPAGTKKL
jgi:hypothetical protein